MRQQGSTIGGLNMRNMGRLLSLLLAGGIVLVSLLGGGCSSADISQSQGNQGEQPGETASPPGITSPVTPAPPAEPLLPPTLPETPAPVDQAPPQTLPGSKPPTVSSLDPTTLITKQASQMLLTIDDMGQGWTRGNAVAPAIQQVSSSSHVYYTQGSSYAPGVQNTVAVYRSIAGAENAFAREKQANLATSNPGIGAECLLNDSVPINKLLVFRKNNVVVWVWLKQYKEGDIERYARIVEQRITPATSLPAAPEPPSQTVTTLPQEVPVEPSAGIQPAIKPADGLVKKQAYQMVLTMEDMGSGWIKGNVSPPANRDSTSSSQVAYSQGSNFAPTVQNSVVVYRNIQAAIKAYASAKPAGVSLSSPSIGDESFLNDSVSIDRLLAFRKGNVVVWVWLKQYKTGDIQGYAKIVENKMAF
jgi:hypothetical protein